MRYPKKLQWLISLSDYEYYVSQQTLPPIERLCDPIEGTDRARIADCLGLDPGRFRSSTTDESEERSFGTLESQLPDSVRFKDADPLLLRCRKCEGQMAFSAIHERAVRQIPQRIFPSSSSDKFIGRIQYFEWTGFPAPLARRL